MNGRTETLPVTFYKRPHGLRQRQEAPCTPEVARLGRLVRDEGFEFEAEVLPDGSVYMDCCNEDEQLSSHLGPNDATVHDGFEAVVRAAAERLALR